MRPGKPLVASVSGYTAARGRPADHTQILPQLRSTHRILKSLHNCRLEEKKLDLRAAHSANRKVCGPAKNRRRMDVENKGMHEFATYSQCAQSKWAPGSGIWTMFSARVVVLIFGRLSTRLKKVRWRQAHRLFFWGNT